MSGFGAIGGVGGLWVCGVAISGLLTSSAAWGQPPAVAPAPAPPAQTTLPPPPTSTPPAQPAPTPPTQPQPVAPAQPTSPQPTAPAQPAPTQPTQPPPPTAVQPAPVSRPATPPPAVDDAAWSALVGRRVFVETRDGTWEGELLRSDGDSLVLVLADGRVQTLPKSIATGVRVAPPAAQPSPTPAAPNPSPTPPPSSTSPGTPTQEPAAAQEGDGEEGEDELTPGEQRRKDRRENREHALLGAFAMHGVTYSHWRGDGVKAGHASYAMDWGIGANLSPTFGIYAMAGGLLGAKIRDNGRIKANYGHFAALFAFGGKYYYSTVGAGVALSRLRFADDTLQKDTGLALPFKLVGKIPLPKKLYIGIGLTYELALVRSFDRAVNAIGGQIVVGRW